MHLKRILRCVFSRFLFKLIIGASLACVIAFSSFAEYARLSAATYMALNYENAAKGLYPNSTRFEMNDVVSEAALDKVIRRLALEDELTSQTLMSMLSIEPRSTRPTLERYIGTEYIISLYLTAPLARVSARDVLMTVCEVYFEDFSARFATNGALEGFRVHAPDTYDYSEISRLFQTRISQLQDYLARRKSENGVFRAGETGETFASLSKRVANFESVVYEKFNAYVCETGLSKDYDSRVVEMSYRQSLLESEYERLSLQYSLRLNAVKLYDTNQTAIVMIPTYDTSRAFYMSKTRTGMDYIAEDAQTYLEKANDVRGQILLREMELSRVTEAQASGQSAYAAANAENMIKSMTGEFNAIIDAAVKTDSAYIVYTLAHGLSFHPRGMSVMTEYNLKLAAAACAGAFSLLTLMQLVYGQQHEKRKKHREIVNAARTE